MSSTVNDDGEQGAGCATVLWILLEQSLLEHLRPLDHVALDLLVQRRKEIFRGDTENNFGGDDMVEGRFPRQTLHLGDCASAYADEFPEFPLQQTPALAMGTNHQGSV